jgi:hypothetical protein
MANKLCLSACALDGKSGECNDTRGNRSQCCENGVKSAVDCYV